MEKKISAWAERASIARRQRQDDVAAASEAIKAIYERLMEAPSEAPAFLEKANLLRKQIEATEQHRTMCVEHGLSDAAIDATYEIQELEKKLVELLVAESLL